MNDDTLLNDDSEVEDGDIKDEDEDMDLDEDDEDLGDLGDDKKEKE